MPTAECKKCGECCTGLGWVLFTPADADRIASAHGMHREEWRKFFGVKRTVERGVVGYHLQLAGECPWLLEGVCAIHDVKPTYCRLWPYGIDRGVREALERGCPMVLENEGYL